MRAVIMQIENGHAAALKEDGTVIKIRDKDYRKGDIIMMKKLESFSIKKVQLWVAAPVLSLVLVFGLFGYVYFTPYYSVSLDVNPGITFSVNSFQRIIDVEAANEDAKPIVNQLKAKNKSIQSGISETVVSISEKGYFNEGLGNIYISTAGDNKLKASKLALELKTTLEQENSNSNISAEVIVSTIDMETVNKAKNQGVTAGKYDLITNGLGIELTEKSKEITMKELIDDAQKGKASSDDATWVIVAVEAYKTKDKVQFMAAMAQLGDALPGIDQLSYGDAREFFEYFISKHMGIEIKSSKMTVNEAVSKVTDFMIQGQIEEAEYYGVDIAGLSMADAQLKIEAAKQEYMLKEAEELKIRAQQYGIDITGLSKEEAWKLIKEKEMQEQENSGEPNLRDSAIRETLAKEYGLDISNVTEEQAIEMIKRARDEQKKESSGGGTPGVEGCRSYAEKINMDISGLSDQQIIDKIGPIMLADNASFFGVDINGMSKEEAWKAISTAQYAYVRAELKAYGVDTTGMDLSKMYDVLRQKNDEAEEIRRLQESWDSLNLRAEIVGAQIDFTGITLEEAESLVVAAEDHYRVRKPLLEQAAQWGFDASNMTNEEIDAKITELLKTPHDFPDEDNN